MSCTGLASCHGDTEDGVGSQVVLVLTAVELEHELIDGTLKFLKYLTLSISNVKMSKLKTFKLINEPNV